MLARILTTVADHYGTTPDQMAAPFLHHQLSEARHVYNYIARAKSNESLATIGKEINRNKCSVLHGTKWVIDKMLIYPEFRTKVNKIAHAIR